MMKSENARPEDACNALKTSLEQLIVEAKTLGCTPPEALKLKIKRIDDFVARPETTKVQRSWLAIERDYLEQLIPLGRAAFDPQVYEHLLGYTRAELANIALLMAPDPPADDDPDR